MVKIGMGTHPKFAELSDSEFRAHVVGVLAIAANAYPRGHLRVGRIPAGPEHVARAAGVTASVARSAIKKLESVDVLTWDYEHGCYEVHDWGDLNPNPSTERSRRFRQRQRNGNATQNGTEKRPDATHEVEEEVEVLYQQVDKDLCDLLAGLILERDPKAKVTPNSKRWLNEMRLLRARDGRSPDDIKRVICWSQSDPFWASNVLSPTKLRKHFTRLNAQQVQSERRVVPIRPRAAEKSDDYLRDYDPDGAA